MTVLRQVRVFAVLVVLAIGSGYLPCATALEVETTCNPSTYQSWSMEDSSKGEASLSSHGPGSAGSCSASAWTTVLYPFASSSAFGRIYTGTTTLVASIPEELPEEEEVPEGGPEEARVNLGALGNVTGRARVFCAPIPGADADATAQGEASSSNPQGSAGDSVHVNGGPLDAKDKRSISKDLNVQTTVLLNPGDSATVVTSCQGSASAMRGIGVDAHGEVDISVTPWAN